MLFVGLSSLTIALSTRRPPAQSACMQSRLYASHAHCLTLQGTLGLARMATPSLRCMQSSDVMFKGSIGQTEPGVDYPSAAGPCSDLISSHKVSDGSFRFVCTSILLPCYAAVTLLDIAAHRRKTYYSDHVLSPVEHPVSRTQSHEQPPNAVALLQSGNLSEGPHMNNTGAFDLSKLTAVSFAAMRLEIGTWQVQPRTAYCVFQLLLYMPCTKVSASHQHPAHMLLVCSSLQRLRRLFLPPAAAPNVS